MSEVNKSLPKWILIFSGLFALLEVIVSFSLAFAPETVVQEVDLSVKGVDYLIYMWASRQFALGIILAVATFKKSIPMLTLAYIFLLVMFLGDAVIGFSQSNTSLVGAGIIMGIISATMIFAISRRR